MKGTGFSELTCVVCGYRMFYVLQLSVRPHVKERPGCGSTFGCDCGLVTYTFIAPAEAVAEVAANACDAYGAAAQSSAQGGGRGLADTKVNQHGEVCIHTVWSWSCRL